jgi:glycosyltransferase involved in cell wall biosynthesis
MARALSEAAVVAAFSDYEAHPVAVMEAVALGVPVVGYDTAGVGDLVADGLVNGIDPDCPPRLAATALSAAMRLRPTPPAHLPTWDEAADALAMLYRSVVQPPIGGKDAPPLGLVASAAS